MLRTHLRNRRRIAAAGALALSLTVAIPTAAEANTATPTDPLAGITSILNQVSAQVAQSIGSSSPSTTVPAGAGTGSVVHPAPAVETPRDSSWSPQPASYIQGALLNVPVYASDGTPLRVNIYYPLLPSGAVPDQKFPVLLQQTPYGKGNLTFAPELTGGSTEFLVQRGFVVVIADVRGTGTSGGTWGVFDPVQASDGATLVDWCSHLPDSDGQVGLFGESYMGINQFLTVGALPKDNPVKAMFPIIAANDIYRDEAFQGGLIDSEFDPLYAALVSGLDAGNPLFDPLENIGANGSQQLTPELLETELEHNASLLSYVGPTVANQLLGGDQDVDGAYWVARNPVNTLAKVVQDNIPAFLVGGWNDLFQNGELLNYTGLQNLSDGRSVLAPMTPDQPVTPRYQLMMGPWMHVTTGNGVNLGQLELEWFDTWLLGQDTPLAHTQDPMHLYQEQSGNWLDTPRWPIPAASATQLYFAPGRSASGALSTNDGELTTSPPTSATGQDAVLWTGLSSACDIQSDQWSAGFIALASQDSGIPNPCDHDDRTLGAGPSALTYTTPPFAQAEDLAGPIDATVFAKANTKDTELVATIEEVSPSGQSEPLTSGALLGSFRALDTTNTWYGSNGEPILPYHPYSQASTQPVARGAITRYDIEIFPTFAQIPAGWSLRVTLTTADDPHLLPSLPAATHLIGGVYRVQRNKSAASFINVPLAPAGSLTTPCPQICSP